jgi:DNA repair exonuclease SbcCD ATPase subunit
MENSVMENSVIENGVMENGVIEMKQTFDVKRILFPTEKYIQEAEKKYQVFPTDMTVPENYDFLKDGVKELKKLITATEKYRKSSQAEAFAFCKATNSVAKFITNRFEKVKQPMFKVLNEYDTKKEIERREKERKEAERQERIENKINHIKNLVSKLILAEAVTIKSQIEELRKDDLAWADEHIASVQDLKESVLPQIEELYNMRLQVENAKAAAEKAEEDRVKKEKEEQSRRDAEQKAIRIENARLKAENEKQIAELRAAAKRIKDQEDAEAAAQKRAKVEKEWAAMLEEKKKKEDAEAAELARIQRGANRQKAVELTVNQIQDYVRSFETNTSDAKIVSCFIDDIQAGNFKHIKWVD